MTAPTAPEIGTVVVDPRFRQRRIAVRKDAGRRRLRRLVGLVVAAAVALTAVIVLESPVLDVDRVTVAGARATSQEAILEAAGIGVGSPILLADLEEAEAAIEGLPWVEEAQVSRDLPGSIQVDLVERTAAAVVAHGTTAVLVDPDGHVLSGADPSTYPPSVEAYPAFVQVVAAAAPPAVGGRVDVALAEAISLADRLRENPPNAVAEVRLEPWLHLVLAGGGVVQFGDTDALDAKLEAFRTVYARVDRTCLSVIDLRVPTHPVLTRSEPCS